MRNIIASITGLCFFLIMTGASAQDSKYYKDGPVINVSYIKIKPGKFEDYMAYLGTTYKSLMEESKKAGLILSYNIYASQPRNPHEADLILTTTYANMAALDKSNEADAVASKVMGAPAVREKKTLDRGVMREVLGSELIREMVLK
jgi:L-rhamnose mutarotase